MKKYILPIGSRIEVIDYDMLVHVDYRQWEFTYSTKEAVFDNTSYLDKEMVQNKQYNNFPHILTVMVKHNKNAVILRTFYNGKIYFARTSKYQLETLGN